MMLALLLPQLAWAQQSHELKDFLRDFHDFSTLPVYSPKTYAAQESTYDRTGGNDDGFGGKYSFVRRNPDSTLVLLDIKGNGVITRFWTPTPATDSLEFYIDRDDRPSFTINYMDLYSGKVTPFVAPLCANQLGGYYCYLPIPFQSSCKIVLKAKHTQFHQIGYKLFPKGTVTKSFSLPLSREEELDLEKIKALWAKSELHIDDLYGKAYATAEKHVALNPSQTVAVLETQKAGRILGFEWTSSMEPGELARDVDIRIRYDDEQTDAVNCPLADYFGYAFGKASMKGLLVGSDGKRHYSWFPMPFDKAAKIELIRRPSVAGSNPGPLEFTFKVYSSDLKRDVDREGKFYARWNRENPVATGSPYTMLNVRGKGHFVGVSLQAQSLRPGITQNFEGDDSTVVDGEMRMHGTGSEDFFNGGWYALMDRWDGATSLPLSGALEYSIPLGRTGGYRFFISDKVPFEKTFLQTIEHGPEGNKWPSDYSSVSYFYCDRSNPQLTIPAAGNTAIYQPDTLEIYPQQMFWEMEGPHSVKTEWTYGPAMTMFFTIHEDSKLKMNMPDIPLGEYQVLLDYVKSPDAADFSIWQRQSPMTDWMSAHQDKKERIPLQSVGHIRITNLEHAFTFHFRTPPGRDRFALTRVVLVRE
jgi:hypothetical protein